MCRGSSRHGNAPGRCRADALYGERVREHGEFGIGCRRAVSRRPSDANQALTDAGAQGAQGEASLRSYFTGHPQQFLELNGIARPLTDQKSQCNSTVSPAQLSALLNALS